MIACIALFFLSVFSQTTYYVATSGRDNSLCGTTSEPCETINQVLINYPGDSYTVSIAAGTYITNPFTLDNDAVVIFQGESASSLPTIVATWRTGSLITNSKASGAEFHNLSITLSGTGDAFIELTGANSVGFYDSEIRYSGDNSEAFVSLYGGSVVVSNVSVSNADINGYFIIDVSDDDDSQITITGSTFTNLTIGDYGALLVFDAYGAADIVLNGSTFNGVFADYIFIGFWAEDSNQNIQITNNVFSNINTYLPSVYVENDYQCVVYVSDSTWTNSTAGFVSGALETLGSDDGVDHNITLNNLVFTNVSGAYAGAILVGFNSLNISGSNFSGNSGEYGNDIVHGLDSYSSQFGHNITDSYSNSELPKAVVWNLSTGSVTDISDELPEYQGTKPVSIRSLTREKISASPKFGRKPRKN